MSLLDQQNAAPPEIRAVVNFLRGKNGPKLRTGVLNGKRIDYFKGSGAVKSLLTPAYAKLKNAPKVTSEQEAVQLLSQTIRFAFFLRVDRGESLTLTSGQTKTKAKNLNINQMQMFEPEMYFAWFYEGSQWTTYLGGVIMVIVLLAGVMFPLWPPMFRQGVSYLSMGVLGLIGLFFVIAILRLIFWLITIVVVPPGIWIFPQLFADVGFVDSFIPVWDWDIKKKKGKKEGKSKKSGKKSDGSRPDSPEGLAPPKMVVGSDSDTSRPPSARGGPTIEEVPDEDD
ncbi:related to translocation protein sec62 [Serendipita indica DSM 11827]|uniref:Translocation protein SEC62 n=1 Tax=Serendipita indica (strain DSM 11827) TaxID=1109443 RepID=G4TM53_SERID|nr:related to translocation protein sec62 [Serendipita indica DSM 11827]